MHLRRLAIGLLAGVGVAGSMWVMFKPVGHASGAPAAGSRVAQPIEDQPPEVRNTLQALATGKPAAPTGAPDSAQRAAPAGATLSDAGPDPQLERIFAEIDAHRLDSALQLTEGLIQRYPNFRLAYLIKGDLLLARTRPIGTLGAAQGAPADRLADLREEAFVRLQAYRHKPPADYVPRYLLQMRRDQQYAIVVDTRKSRLYLYRNDQGRPRFVADYYVTQGKLGAEKTSEGDKRTPIGVYHVTASLPRDKLADLYGHGAFPLDYPNEWDKRHGRSGSGIWLHGTPAETFSRPPKASDGCVVLTNPDLDSIGKNLQVGLTPVIISNDIEWLSLDDWNKERNELNQTIEAWRADWESRDIERYLSHYSRDFQSSGQNYARFAEQKRQVNAGKTWVKVRLDNLSVFRNPGPEEVVVVTFDQVYESNNLNNTMKKRQYWVRERGHWKIIYEGSA